MTQPRPSGSAGAPQVDNPGIAYRDADVPDLHVNLSASERRAATLPARRSVKKNHQAAWLLKAVTMIDLTTLAGDDTPGRVQRLCAKARNPVRHDVLSALGMQDERITTGAVCVYPTMVPHAAANLKGSGIPVASVATGFPAGLMPLELRIQEVAWAVEQGAHEIDVVITREHALTGNWAALHEELTQFKAACGSAHMKVILAVGELGTQDVIAKASWVAMMAGADFIKTSTGKESVNATLVNSLTMVRALRHYHDVTGHTVGFKPAGGIKTAKQALAWLALIKDELGDRWLHPNLFRFGASSLLGDIERQLEHHVTGRYAAAHHQPLA